jgi:hypothetical protein
MYFSAVDSFTQPIIAFIDAMFSPSYAWLEAAVALNACG